MNEQAESQANDLDVLLPDRELAVGGDTVTVREFTFLQGLQAEALVRPMIQDLQALFGAEDDGADEALEFASMAEIFGRHAEAFLTLIATSCGKSREWVAGLSDHDGQILAMTFWSVNARFFTRRLVVRQLTGQLRSAARAAAAAATPDTAPSSQH
ncbi:MAG: DUF6631 family protein [Burkholderiaceae bacterium]